MNRNLLKKPDRDTIKIGDLVWLDGGWEGNSWSKDSKISGPFFVKMVLFRQNTDARIDVLNVENGEVKSLMVSWLYVLKEQK